MKYLKTKDLYKAANVSFDPNKLEAFSYNWWCFVKVINGQVVFNNYRYSVTTAKHQSTVKALMRDLGIAIDLEVNTALSLNNERALGDALNTADRDAINLHAEMIRGRDNWNRIARIGEIRLNQDRIERLMSQGGGI